MTKSQEYQTTCVNCVFADWDTGSPYQVGCKVRPLMECDDHLGDGYWNLKRLCHYKREDGWLQSAARKQVRKEVTPTYTVAFNMDDNDPQEIYTIFSKSRIAPSTVLAYTTNIDKFYQVGETLKTRPSYCTVRLMQPEIDPQLEILRSEKNKYVWFLKPGETPYKDLFWWVDRQVNDLEWRYGLIEGIWPIALFKACPGLSLAAITEKVKSEDNLYYEYDFITKCATSNIDWSWKQACFITPSADAGSGESSES